MATQRLRQRVAMRQRVASSQQSTSEDLFKTMLKPLREAEASSNRSSDLAGVTAALMKMANGTQNASENKGVVDSMQDLVDQMQDHIHSSLVPEQEYLDKVHGYFGDCGKTLQEQLDIAGLQNSSVDDARSVHKKCRVEQAQVHEEWSKCMLKASLEARDCYGWPALQATKISDAGATCLQTPPGETLELYLHRMKSHWEDELAKYLAMKARCADSLEDPCAQEKAKLDLKITECNTAQGSFEGSFCDKAKQANRAWHNYQECYRVANETYTQASTASTKLLYSKRLDLGASHRIECLLKVFDDKHNAQEALEECKATDHSDKVAKLRLAIKEAPPPIWPPVALNLKLPGQIPFEKEEYDQVNVTEMMTCLLPFTIAYR